MHENDNLGGRILKVNHAGENGAVSIYAGQILAARLTARDLVPELRNFKMHEERHRAIFGAEMLRRGQPRCRSYLLCGIGGYILGILTGIFGRRAIAATTVAVESVVLRHLAEQLNMLRGKDAAAVEAISAIVREEQQHHDHSKSYLSHGDFWSRILSPVVSVSTEAVIWIGMRL
jgi:ubiquinone biosynthesis monooxygenase Coq7